MVGKETAGLHSFPTGYRRIYTGVAAFRYGCFDVVGKGKARYWIMLCKPV